MAYCLPLIMLVGLPSISHIKSFSLLGLPVGKNMVILCVFIIQYFIKLYFFHSSSTITRSFEVSFDMIVFNPHKQNTKGTICLSGKSTLKKYLIEKKPIIPQKELWQIGQLISGFDHFSPSLSVIHSPCFSNTCPSWKTICIAQIPKQTGINESKNSTIYFYPVNPTIIFTS